MTIVSVEGGPLTMRQLERWSKDRLILEIEDVSNVIRRLRGLEPRQYTVAWFNAMRRGFKHNLAKELLGLFDQYEALLREREERERRINNEAVRRTLGLTIAGRSVYEGVAAP